MKYDIPIDVAFGLSANSKVWKNKKIMWSEFVDKISKENKTNETYKEFIAASKEEQSKIKDVGGYVGGYLRGGRRNPKNVVYRQLLTLDIDFAHRDFWEDFCLQYNNAAILHGTHKNCEADPRYRLLIPVNREVTPDEYVAISRQVAGVLGIDLFDNTTFETNRLMFWPSNPVDVDYYCKVQDGPMLDADEVLDSYIDWKDTSLWPTADRKVREIGEAFKKQQDPKDKKGIVGYFCRTFTITEVIEKFLSDVYVEAVDGRYTYKEGTTSGGLMIYDDLFAFSHHGTDPCSGKLSNAFDLVRIHKFGHLDEDSTIRDVAKSKSFSAMDEFCRSNKEVKKIIAVENIASSKYDFIEDINEDINDEESEDEEDDINWMTELEADSKGNYLSSAVNINIILANDSRLKSVFKQNDFDTKRYVFTSLPWRRIDKPEPVKNVDYSGVRNYIESIYGISGTLKIDDSLALEFEKQSFHPIREYLSKLVWDKSPRVDTLLINYFGCDDNIYIREAIRKMLVASVARTFKPGCKFDLVLTLVGEQGTKKSTFFKKLGKEWFSDTFMTVHGKEALEQIQGAWIIEMAELSGLRKAEVESVKHFISKQEDVFRPAYARTSETFPRQCVFVGTTNKKDFLTDVTGNRRFMPIDVNKSNVKKDVFTELDLEIDQIWAEAVHLYRKGETLFLSDDAEFIAKGEQIKHSEVDDRRGIVDHFLDMKLPVGWDKMHAFERKDWLTDPLSSGTVERDFVCVAELWCECLLKEKDSMTRYNTRDLNDIMKSLDNWEYVTSTRNFPLYGKQKYYTRKLY